MFHVVGSRVGRRAGGARGVLRRARRGRAGAGLAHREQRAPRALVRRVRAGRRAVEPVADLRLVAVQRLGVGNHRRATLGGLAMVGGVLRYVLPVSARHGGDGRHPAGDGAPHRAAARPAAGCPVDRGALCQQHLRRGARRAGHRVLADSRRRARAQRGGLHRPQSAVRRDGAGRLPESSSPRLWQGLPLPPAYGRGGRISRGWRRFRVVAPRVHGPAGHRVRSRRRSRPQSGHGRYRLHVRAAARGLSGGQRRWGSRISALAGRPPRSGGLG